jgi:Virulence protein RhuM family
VRKTDAEIAKNCLTKDELQILNRIVTLYLYYTELQALGRTPMTMRHWATKLDEFPKVAGRHRARTSASDARHVVAGVPRVRTNEDDAMLCARPRGVGAGGEVEGLGVRERIGESEASAQGLRVVEHARRVPPRVGGVAVGRHERSDLDAECMEVLDERIEMRAERRWHDAWTLPNAARSEA